jgi:alpha-mannosidase
MKMVDRKIVIVPHAHWDREWYEPFQKFRYMLVELIDELLEILKQQGYKFMLDGQTIVLEDYFEIRPDRKEELLEWIRKGNIVVGPWYILPDEWLVGGESLIRNLEYSHDLASRLKIPQMQIAYLPDQFGHSSTMPQIIANLTNFKAAVLWRGVPPEILTVPFFWKSHQSSKASIFGVYLPSGYGNAARFPEEYDKFVEAVNENLAELEHFSPVPVFLLMNGSDHHFPQPFVQKYCETMRKGGLDITLGFLTEYINFLEKAIAEENYTPPIFNGEFRSPARAPLLQDTYSARMWIKLWNQRIEDLLIQIAEPITTYVWFALKKQYASGFLETAWKWLLRNHPHDSICGCSVDQTHDEMKTRFSWAESIAESVIERAINTIETNAISSDESNILVFYSGNSSDTPVYVEFTQPKDRRINGIRGPDGTMYYVQPLKSREDIFFETTIGLRAAKMGMRLLPGRKLMGFYINGVEYYDGDEPGLLELRFDADTHPIGEFDIKEFKQDAMELIESKRYKKIHLIAARPTQRVYAAVLPLQPWAFTKLLPVVETSTVSSEETLQVNDNHVSNQFYSIDFTKEGSLSLTNLQSGMKYEKLHIFEDFGDRGDEYTFGKVEPEKVKVKKVKRSVQSNGPVLAEIKQTQILEVYESLDNSREKRVGKVEIPVESIFRFYHDLPRIDVITRLTNKAKDHRLRICFELPYTSDTTITSTHFGWVERKCDPEKIPDPSELERTKSSFPEMPSGIQPQKRFIRVDDKNGEDGITIFNKGIPEVELVDRRRIALTLVRSVGALSRSDYPERPIHAGPSEETDGAQVIDTSFEYHYGFVIHHNDEPIHFSADNADLISGSVTAISLDHADISPEILEPIIRIDDPAIRISSFRVRDNAVLVTLYNIENTEIECHISLARRIQSISKMKIDGSVSKVQRVNDGISKLIFNPREIKMCMLSDKS